ncbi:AraC family transcriptional regulator [Acinetobacter sp. ESBL14]|uniref:AraC family transcriptional regulator n=1 Tax=Acinetobacter sp. ESBL14 TaxID=3077329 RepID=UPI002FC92DD8
MDGKRSLRVRFSAFKYFVEHYDFKDLDRVEILKVVGVDEEFYKKEKQYVSLEIFERLIIYLDNNSDDPLWFVHFLLKDGAPLIGVLGMLLSVCSNLGEALNVACKYREINGDVGEKMVVSEDDYYIFLEFINVSNSSFLIQKSIEFRYALWIDFIKSKLGGNSQYVKYIHFKHNVKNSEVKKVFDSYFNIPVSFGMNRNLLAISKDALKKTFKSADQELYFNLEKYVVNVIGQNKPEDEISNRVKFIISFQLQKGVISREIAAEKLGLNIRTLTRRLNDEGTTYTKLLEEVRLETAKEYLSNSNASVIIISKNLGFFTSNAFITWFKSLTGVTPKNYRELLAK